MVSLTSEAQNNCYRCSFCQTLTQIHVTADRCACAYVCVCVCVRTKINTRLHEASSLSSPTLPGAGIFVTTIVVGVVTITKPFTLTQRPFLRDIIFYMFAAYWTFYLLWSGYVNIYHAVGFVAFYVFYVVVVIVGRIVFQRWKKYRQNKRLGTGDIPSKFLLIISLQVV